MSVVQTGSPLWASHESISKDRIIAEPGQGCSWLSSWKLGFGGFRGVERSSRGEALWGHVQYVPDKPCSPSLAAVSHPQCLHPGSERDLCFGIEAFKYSFNRSF